VGRPRRREPVLVVGHSGVRLPLPAAWVRRVVRSVLEGERRQVDVGVTFVGPGAMRKLNLEWKGREAVTDVLAFPLRHPGGRLTGDVYICAAEARRQARLHGVPAAQELVRLVIHGTLHVLGYDHPDGPGRTHSAMWRRQERYVKAFT
jgi:probable rRNA maturation factor